MTTHPLPAGIRKILTVPASKMTTSFLITPARLKFLKILKMRQPHLFQHPRASSGTIKRQIEGIARYYYIPEHDHRVIGLWIPVGRNRVSKIMHKYYDKLFEPAPKK